MLRDKTHKPGKPPVAAETVARVVALTCAAPPHQATHWIGQAAARAVGICLTSVQRIWAAHKPEPHHVHRFKGSRAPESAAKLAYIVGLYMVLSGVARIHLVAGADLATGSVLRSGMGRNAVCRVRFEGGDRAA